MILYIAEKPSLGRAIADALPKPQKKAEGYITLANGDCVSWCVGHLLEQAPPDAYGKEFKSWKFESLPIIPDKWKLIPKKNTSKQLSVLKKLIAKASVLVNAGDPDREGQLLVDEVIAYFGVTGDKLHQAKRLLINDLTPKAVKVALGKMRANKEFIPLSTSALARSRADWLYGMNMTRAYTLKGQQAGYQGVLSVGRVQTPLLGLVVRRDQQIKEFVSKPFYEVWAQLQTQSTASTEIKSFEAKWQPSENCRPYMDDEGRVLAPKLAQNVASRIKNKPACVQNITASDKKQAPPLPFSLSALQIEGAKKLHLSAKQVLDCCQSLYEKHKLITYPRSDSRYLPLEQHSMAGEVIDTIKAGAPAILTFCVAPDPTLKSKAWNNSKVDAHHAIIPTTKKAVLSSLSPQERQLYLLVATQYMAQFYPPYQYSETKVDIVIEGGHFKAQAKQDNSLGWKQLFLAPSKKNAKVNDTEVNAQPVTPNLPKLVKGQNLLCVGARVQDKQTEPPKHFSDASLLSAMTGINRFVQDVQIRSILKETDGLGTEATRAGIIELLFKRQYLQRQGKLIVATPIGVSLIQSLPEFATSADMTALWEMNLQGMSKKEVNYQSFMSSLVDTISSQVSKTSRESPTSFADLAAVKMAPTKRKYTKSVKNRKPKTASKATQSRSGSPKKQFK